MPSPIHHYGRKCKKCGSTAKTKWSACVNSTCRGQARWNKRNPKNLAENTERWRNKDANREVSRKAHRLWAKTNPTRNCYHTQLRKARKRKACPSWVNTIEIKEIYDNCPKGMHVDHIIPLAGKTVSGLHVPRNLQYLTPEENRRKHNKFIERI